MPNSDPQKWTRTEVVAALNALAIPEATLYQHRKDRHDPTSDLQALTLHVAGVMTYDAITQIAGLFETPHITFKPSVRSTGPEAGTCGADCQECFEPYTEIIVSWEAPVPVSKVPA